MQKPDYTEFDKALLNLIANGCDTMMQLDSMKSGLRKLAEKFHIEDRHGLTPHFRIIDRRLQALRKKGAIRFDGKVWTLLGAHP